jgi:hypothetical protein
MSFWEMWFDGLLLRDGWFSAILTWTLTLIVGGIIYAIGYWVWDELTIERGLVLEGPGKILKKEYHAAYTTTSYHKVGNVNVPTTHFHPARYMVLIGVEDGGAWVNSQGLYDSLVEDLTVRYHNCKRYGKHVRYEIVSWYEGT